MFQKTDMEGEGALSATDSKCAHDAKEQTTHGADELCSYCEFKLDPFYIRMHCHVCKDFSLCLNCYLSQAEYKLHNNDHFMYPRTAFNIVAWPDGWTILDDLSLLEAIEIHGMGSWEPIRKFMHRPADEPVEAIIRHFNHVFANGGVMGAPVLDTLVDDEAERQFFAKLPNLDLLQHYSRAMDSFAERIYKNVKAACHCEEEPEGEHREQQQSQQTASQPQPAPQTKPIDKPPSEVTTTGMRVQCDPPVFDLARLSSWPEHATPEIISSVMEYVRDPPRKRYEETSKSFKTVPKDVYDDVMQDFPDLHASIFKDFILNENSSDLGLMTEGMRLYPQGTELKDIPHNSGEGDGKKFVYGSWPLRKDFNVEYVNRAEYPLMFMHICHGRETKLSMQIKVRTLQAYVVRLLERERRKHFVFQFSLHRTDFAIDESTLALDEETIRRQGREAEFKLPLSLTDYRPTDNLINKFEATHSWLHRAFSTRLEFRNFAALHIQEYELRKYIHTLQIARFLGLRSRDQLIDVDVFLRNPLFYAEQYSAQNELRRRLPPFLCLLTSDNKDKSGTSTQGSPFFENPGQRQSILEGICMSAYLADQLRILTVLNSQVEKEREISYFVKNDAGQEHAELIYAKNGKPTRYLPRTVVDVDPGTNTGILIEVPFKAVDTLDSVYGTVAGRFNISSMWYAVRKDVILKDRMDSTDALTLDHILTHLFKYCGGVELMNQNISSICSDTLMYRTIDILYKLFCISKSSVEVLTASRLSCGAIITLHMVSLSLLGIMTGIAYNNSFIQSLFNDEMASYLQKNDDAETKSLTNQPGSYIGDADEQSATTKGDPDTISTKGVLEVNSAPLSADRNATYGTAPCSPAELPNEEPPLKKIPDDDNENDDNGTTSSSNSPLSRKVATISQTKPTIANTVIMDVYAHHNILVEILPWLGDIFTRNKAFHDAKRITAQTQTPQTSSHAVYQIFIQWLSAIMAKSQTIFTNEQQPQHENALYTKIGGAQASVLQMLLNTFRDMSALKPVLKTFIASFTNPDPDTDAGSVDMALQEAICATGSIVEYTLQQYRRLFSNDITYSEFASERLLGNITYLTTKLDRLAFNNVHVFSTFTFFLHLAPISALLGTFLAGILPHIIMTYGLKSPFVSPLTKLLTDRRYDVLFEANVNAPSSMPLAELGHLGNVTRVAQYQRANVPEGTLTDFVSLDVSDTMGGAQHSKLKLGLISATKDNTVWLPFSAYGLYVSTIPQTHRKKIFEAYHQVSCLVSCAELDLHYKERNSYMFFGAYNTQVPQSYAIPYEMCTVNLWLALKYLPAVAETDAPYHKAAQKLKKIANKCANINPVTVMMSEYQVAKLSKAEYRDLRIRLCTTDRKVVLYTLRDYSRHMFFKIADTLLTLTQQKLNILAEQNRQLLANDPFYRDQVNVKQQKRTVIGQAGRNITDAFNHSNITLIASQFNALTEHDHFLLRYDSLYELSWGTHEPSAKSRVIAEKLKLQGLDPAVHYIIEPKEYLFGPVMPRKSCMQTDGQTKAPSILPLNMRARIVKPHQMRYLHSVSTNTNDLMSHNEFCSRYLTRGEVIFLALSEIDLDTYLFAKEAFIASGYIITRAIFSIFDCKPSACEIMAILVISALCNQSVYSTVPMISSFDSNKVDYSVEWAHCTPYHVFIHTLGEHQTKDEAVATEVTAHTDIKLKYGNREISTITSLRLPKFRFEPNIVSVDNLNVPITLLQKADEVIDKDSFDKIVRSYRSIFMQSHFVQDYRLANSAPVGPNVHEQQGSQLPPGHQQPNTLFSRRSQFKNVIRVDAGMQTDLSFWRDEKERIKRTAPESLPNHGQQMPAVAPASVPGASLIARRKPMPDNARLPLPSQINQPSIAIARPMVPAMQPPTSLSLNHTMQQFQPGQAQRPLEGPLPINLPRNAPELSVPGVSQNMNSHAPIPPSRGAFPFATVPSLQQPKPILPQTRVLPTQHQHHTGQYMYQQYLTLPSGAATRIPPPPQQQQQQQPQSQQQPPPQSQNTHHQGPVLGPGPIPGHAINVGPSAAASYPVPTLPMGAPPNQQPYSSHSNTAQPTHTTHDQAKPRQT